VQTSPRVGNGPDTTWLVRPVARPQAAIRLLCFPYAGAGASAFAVWAYSLPPEVELWVVQLPGRETRLREPLLEDLGTISDEISRSIEPLCDRPLAFFGHSMGALIAFETAKRVRARGMTPSALFLSGKGVTYGAGPLEGIEHLSDDEFIRLIDQRYGGVPALLKEDAEFRQLYLPALRADIAAVSRHRPTAATPFECPVHVLGGISDQTASRDSLEAWSREAVGHFNVHMFPGGHFFVQTARAAVLELLMSELSKTVDKEASRI
jgi:medium-chain acyl-[acyl-carrier-protein] hydrolase